jgi:hypothetical protein
MCLVDHGLYRRYSRRRLGWSAPYHRRRRLPHHGIGLHQTRSPRLVWLRPATPTSRHRSPGAGITATGAVVYDGGIDTSSPTPLVVPTASVVTTAPVVTFATARPDRYQLHYADLTRIAGGKAKPVLAISRARALILDIWHVTQSAS